MGPLARLDRGNLRRRRAGHTRLRRARHRVASPGARLRPRGTRSDFRRGRRTRRALSPPRRAAPVRRRQCLSDGSGAGGSAGGGAGRRERRRRRLAHRRGRPRRAHRVDHVPDFGGVVRAVALVILPRARARGRRGAIAGVLRRRAGAVASRRGAASARRRRRPARVSRSCGARARRRGVRGRGGGGRRVVRDETARTRRGQGQIRSSPRTCREVPGAGPRGARRARLGRTRRAVPRARQLGGESVGAERGSDGGRRGGSGGAPVDG